MKPTQFTDVNQVLNLLTKGLTRILDQNLIGLYLTGSLTYGGFDRRSSDIDFLAILDHTLSQEQLQKVKKMHLNIGKSYPKWRKRIEGSYITKAMVSNIKRPKVSRPYVNAGKMWGLVYGNEWILNLHVLYKYGISLVGPDPKKLIKPVNINDVREAAKKNLFEEWQPKLKEPAPFKSADYDSNHLQTYAILTMCRVLHTARNDNVASKRVASAWVKKTYGKPWSDLIEKAENWKHGKKMNSQKETIEFIKFVYLTLLE